MGKIVKPTGEEIVSGLLNPNDEVPGLELLNEFSWILADWMEANQLLEAMGIEYLQEDGYMMPMSMRIKEAIKRKDDGTPASKDA